MRLVLSQAVERSMSLEQATSEFRRPDEEYRARVAYWQANPPFGLRAKLLGAQHEVEQAFIAASKKVLDALAAQAWPWPR